MLVKITCASDPMIPAGYLSEIYFERKNSVGEKKN